MNRSLVFVALFAGVGLGAWCSYSVPLTAPGLNFGALASTLQHFLQPKPFEAPASVTVVTTDDYPSSEAIFLNAALTVEDQPALPVADSVAGFDQVAAPETTCSAWSISEVGMETVIREMIRQGWTPPTRSEALSQSQPVGREPIEAIDPDLLALPVSSPDNRDNASPNQADILAY